MAASEDLINFDIIETQKENIQSLPQGRSAKALATAFGPTPFSPVPTPGSTRNLNDAIRSEYEKELQNIGDSDDPLDVYDRYVKWTLNAYPSSQATSESQLRPLLERATKAFQNVQHYKNDPRYLKLWVHYIRFFSDAPRETFAYLSRHGIGETLALFYEEFAVWLESAGRWTQAEEVYKLGIEREARPTERLLRKFGEFQMRFEQRPADADEPSSPALPTVRPALAAKLDPFASTPRAGDPQSQRLPSQPGASRSSKSKLAIFSDAETAPPRPGSGDTTKGWDNIGTIAERKKENTVEARPWVGETLKAGKKPGTQPKMAVFKDESNTQSERPTVHQRTTTNQKTGRTEHVFVNLEAVYPNPNNLTEEYSLEELRARQRGWLQKKWVPEPVHRSSQASEDLTTNIDSQQDVTCDVTTGDFTTSDFTLGGTKKSRKDRSHRPRRKKIMEVRGETQTVKINLDSPAAAGRKLKRKNSAEPTMTMHTKAANEEMLDIFNQPLGHVAQLGDADVDSAEESEYDTDDYTSGGESTGTGRISGATSECGDETSQSLGDEITGRSVVGVDISDPKSVSPWSDFTKSKHVPALQSDDSKEDDSRTGTGATFHTGLESIDENAASEHAPDGFSEDVPAESIEAAWEMLEEFPEEELDFIAPSSNLQFGLPLSIPIPPPDFEVPSRPYRDAASVAQSRLPFMTPIVERTECSIPSVHHAEAGDYFSAKTPSRRRNDADPALPQIDDLLLSSPFQEIVNDARPERAQGAVAKAEVAVEESSNPLIKDAQCNPLDPAIRATILEHAQPMLDSLGFYHDHRPANFGHGPELRRYAKAIAKSSKPAEKSAVPEPPQLSFPGSEGTTYTIKRELGKGAFAPVYLASTDDESVAIKAEDPPSAWEFYAMTLAHSRLTGQRTADSLARAQALHLFADEGYLMESYHEQGTLLDLSNVSKADSAATGGAGLLDECVAMFFAAELLRTLQGLHSAGILHGDVKADNCLVRLSTSSKEWEGAFAADGSGGWDAKGIALIDFGRAIDRRSFAPETRFIADWVANKYDCPAVREAKPWTVHADYWGAAGVVHLLLFGKWMEEIVEEAPAQIPGAFDVWDETESSRQLVGGNAKRYRVREAFKRYWATDVWSGVFDKLLNPDGQENGLSEALALLENWLSQHAEKKGLRGKLGRIEERLREARRK